MWNIPSNSNPHIRDNILDMLNTLGKWLQKGSTLSVSLLRQLQAWICEVLQSTCSPLIRNVLDQPSYLPKFHNLGGEILALHCVCELFMCVFELADRRYCYFFKTDMATLSEYRAKFIWTGPWRNQWPPLHKFLVLWRPCSAFRTRNGLRGSYR